MSAGSEGAVSLRPYGVRGHRVQPPKCWETSTAIPGNPWGPCGAGDTAGLWGMPDTYTTLRAPGPRALSQMYERSFLWVLYQVTSSLDQTRTGVQLKLVFLIGGTSL